jgi:hypothetical protein
MTGNEATVNNGGAIFMLGTPELNVYFSELTDNIAANNGGAIAGANLLNLYYTAVRNNTAGNDGAGLRLEAGQYNINYSEVGSNRADRNGGGIDADSGTGTLTLNLLHSTVGDNYADNLGGGLKLFKTDSFLTFSTIVSNTAAINGGGFYNHGSGGVMSVVTMQNSAILANGTTVAATYDCANVGADADTVSLGYNRFSNAALGQCHSYLNEASDDPINIPSDHLDLDLLDNGGNTRTNAIFNGSELHNIIPDGVNGCEAGDILDQRGQVRANGTGMGGTTCDIGAFEFNAQCPTPTVPPNLEITPLFDDMLLTWDETLENTGAELWVVSDDPYFDPTSPGNQTPTTSFQGQQTYISDFIDDSDHYYVIRGIGTCDDFSTDVGRVGKIQYEMVPGDI